MSNKLDHSKDFLKIERRSPRIAVNVRMLTFMLKLIETELHKSSKAYKPDDIYLLVLWKERIEKALANG